MQEIAAFIELSHKKLLRYTQVIFIIQNADQRSRRSPAQVGAAFYCCDLQKLENEVRPESRE